MDKLEAVLSSKIQERIADLQIMLGDGNAKDFPTYQNIVGQIKGLLGALSVINTLFDGIRREDEL